MENKINVAELLKNCPKGMELDCTIYGDVILDCVTFESDYHYCGENNYPIKISIKGGFSTRLTKYGQNVDIEEAKCVIFPKGKTTWEGFIPPCKFKEGDVVTYKYENGLVSMILSKFVNFVEVHYHCALYDNEKGFITDNYIVGEPKYTHLATEEEKQKLFNAIKANGYRWNNETKTLERLDEPIFNIGDWVTDGTIKCQIRSINDNKYWYSLGCVLGPIESVNKKYHLWTIQDAKDGDVLYSPSHNLIWIYEDDDCYYACVNMNYAPGNISIDGFIGIPKDACPATKDKKTVLFARMKEAGYIWNIKTKTLEKLPKFKVGDRVVKKESIYVPVSITKVDNEFYYYKNENRVGFFSIKEQDDWELAHDKFDITTLKPFDKVLVRDNDNQKWTIDYFSFIDKEQLYPFVCVGHYIKQCIPYKGNEHLLGTISDCDKFYKTWE